MSQLLMHLIHLGWQTDNFRRSASLLERTVDHQGPESRGLSVILLDDAALQRVLEGEGVLHLDGNESTPIGPGSCIHLPPLHEHSLENVGDTPMRVLGVFHPSGDPASRATEANQ